MTNHFLVIFKLVYILLDRNIFLLWGSFCPFPFGFYFWDKAIINKPFGRRKKEDSLSQAESPILILSKHAWTQGHTPQRSGKVYLILTKISKAESIFILCSLSIKYLQSYYITVLSQQCYSKSQVFPLFISYSLLSVCTRHWPTLGGKKRILYFFKYS